LGKKLEGSLLVRAVGAFVCASLSVLVALLLLAALLLLLLLLMMMMMMMTVYTVVHKKTCRYILVVFLIDPTALNLLSVLCSVHWGHSVYNGPKRRKLFRLTIPSSCMKI